VDKQVVLRFKGYSFFFFSNEENPPDPAYPGNARGGTGKILVGSHRVAGVDL